MVEREEVAGLTVFYEQQERTTAEAVILSCETTIPIIQNQWGLSLPADCQVFVTTSWQQFFELAPPSGWRLLLKLSKPFWRGRAEQTWPISAGWYQRFGHRAAIAVKPARLIQEPDTPLDIRVFVPINDPKEKVMGTTCHELTHACSAHLQLPMWLYEGLAMITVDKMQGKATVETGSLAFLRRSLSQPATYQQRRYLDLETYAAHVVRGYWLTRYLDETQPELLKALLMHKMKDAEQEKQIADSLHIGQDLFWQEVDELLVSHYTPGEGSPDD